MSNKDDGGPAFPSHEQWNEWSELKAEYVPRTGPMGGMSLRDYFAIHFAAAACSRECVSDFLIDEGIAGMVEESYKRADAMLAERSKP